MTVYRPVPKAVRGNIALDFLHRFAEGAIRANVIGGRLDHYGIRGDVCDQLLARDLLEVVEEPGDLSPALDGICTTEAGRAKYAAVARYIAEDLPCEVNPDLLVGTPKYEQDRDHLIGANAHRIIFGES